MLIKETVPKIQLPNMNLHGHICIDLHNHNSGFTERVEADNTVNTKLLELFFQIYANPVTHRYMKPSSSGTGVSLWNIVCNSGDVSSDTSKAEGSFMSGDGVGGLHNIFSHILLFKNSNNKDDDDFTIPGSSIVVGDAGIGTNTVTTGAGSYNVLESKITETSVTRVWDFSTSQCNSKISSIGMDKSFIGYGAFINGDVTANMCDPNDLSKMYRFWEERKNSGVIYPVYSDVISLSHKVHFADFGDAFTGDLNYSDFSYSSSSDSNHPASNKTSYWTPDGKIFYWLLQRSRCMYKFDFSVSPYKVTKIACVMPANWDSYSFNYSLIDEKTVVYERTNSINSVSHHRFYIANIIDGSYVECLDYTSSTDKQWIFNHLDGVVYISVQDRTKTYIAKNDMTITELPTNLSLVSKDFYEPYPNRLNPLFRTEWYDRDYRYRYGLYGQLVTKANIEPVTKTATQSMKITYKITAE